MVRARRQVARARRAPRARARTNCRNGTGWASADRLWRSASLPHREGPRSCCWLLRCTLPACQPSAGASCGRISCPLLSVVKRPIGHRRKIPPHRAIRGTSWIVNDSIPWTHAQAPPGVRGGVHCRLRARPSWLVLRLRNSPLGGSSWPSLSPTTTYRRWILRGPPSHCGAMAGADSVTSGTRRACVDAQACAVRLAAQ